MSWIKNGNLRGPAGTSGTSNATSGVTLDTTQTVTGAKDFTGGLTVNSAPVVTTADARLSDMRTPSDGSVTTEKITSGGIAPSAITGTAVTTGDVRLSNSRTPTDASVTTAKIAAGGLAPSAITGTAVITSDARLSDARTPTAHAASHGTNGSDAVTITENQVTGLVSDLAGKVDLSSAQTISGAKTFSNAASFVTIAASSSILGAGVYDGTSIQASNRVYSPNNLVPVAGLSASGTAGATTFLRGDGTWAVPTGSAPSNMVTTDTGQTISGAKTFSAATNFNNNVGFNASLTANAGIFAYGNSNLYPSGSATSGTTTVNGALLRLQSFYWNGASSVSDTSLALQAVRRSATAGDQYLSLSGDLTSTGKVTGTTGIFDGANRVYSAGNLVPVAGLSTTGAASAATFLRGDGAWSAISGITGLAPSAITGTAVITTDSRLSDQRVPLDASVTLAKLSATGTPSATTFLRGDGAWATALTAAPANMVTTDSFQSLSASKTFNAGLSLGATSAAASSASNFISFIYTNASASQGTVQVSGTANGRLTVSGGALDATSGVYDTGNRVWSASNAPAAGAIAATAISGTAVITTDGRLSDTRTPTDSSVTTAKIAPTGLAPSAITGTAVITTDSRLSDTRTPTDLSVTAAKIATGGLPTTAITGTAVDLASAQTIAGAKTFSSALTVTAGGIFDGAANRVYSAANPVPTLPQLTQVQRTAQTVAASSDTIVLFETAESSSGANVSNYITYSAGVFTAVKTGLYFIEANIRIPANATGERYMAIGSNISGTYATSRWASNGGAGTGSVSTMNAACMRYLTAGTTFAVWMFSGGFAPTLAVQFDSTRCTVVYLG